MKSFILLLVLFVFVCMPSASRAQRAPKSYKFTIEGQVEGLMPGDTLRFECVELPYWELKPGFDVVVTTSDKFKYKGKQLHSQYYLMTYLPRSGAKQQFTVRGVPLLIDGGTILIKGLAESIYFSRVEGEAFGKQPLLQKAQALDNSLQMERSRLLSTFQEAYATGDTEKGKEYQQQFNSFPQDCKNEFTLVNEWRNEFLRSFPSSQWSIIHQMQRSSYMPLDELQDYYAKIDLSARKSYYGDMLVKMIDTRIRLAPGKEAPAFGFVLPDGKKMNFKELQGKYLLVYHWSFCPGSLAMETEIVSFYNRYKEHLEIVGVTDDLAIVRQTAATTPTDAEMMGIKLKPIMESMAVHPWQDIEDKGENRQVGELFAFAGYPFFVGISPDGKIISRGFHEAFYEFSKAMETGVGKK